MNDNGRHPRRRLVLVSTALVAATFAVYWAVRGNGFVNYDDPAYVTHNQAVLGGFGWSGIRWAFTHWFAGNYHPLTWISHMLDVQVFGLDAGGHHLVNVALHATNAVLLLAALWTLTRAFWPSVLVAALFALHPTRVESVAWVAERKDVLSSTFWMLTLLAYARYARRPGRRRMALVTLTLALGLLTKSMLVTLPFVLLLLDYWPLGRWRPEEWGADPEDATPSGRLIREKLPLFLLVLATCAVTVLAQDAGGTIGSLANLPLDVRVANAFVACVAYLRMTLWPTGLAVFYPHPALVDSELGRDLLVPALFSAVLLVAITVATVRLRRRCPYLLVGWLWFLGTLVPVIGIFQVGSQAYADRYTYLPLIGVYLGVAFGFRDLVAARPRVRVPVAGACLLLLLALASVTQRQVGFWHDDGTLNEHALAVTEQNYVAHGNLGLHILDGLGDPEGAAVHFAEAARLNPVYLEARYNLGVAMQRLGRLEEAAEHYELVLRLQPGHPQTLNNMALLQRQGGDDASAREGFEEILRNDPENTVALVELAGMHFAAGESQPAHELYERAVRTDPTLLDAHFRLGCLDLEDGDPLAAAARFDAVVALDPGHAVARGRLGEALMRMNELERAAEELDLALQLDPELVAAHVHMGELRIREGDLDGALESFEAGLEVDPDNPGALDGAGVVLLETGRLDEARSRFETALAVDPEYVNALNNLGVLHERSGAWLEAARYYRLSLDTEDPDPFTAGALAWLLATCPDTATRNGEEAVRWARYAGERTGFQRASNYETLGAALAEAGRFEEALEAVEEALSRARAQKQIARLEAERELYRGGRPYRAGS